MSVDIVPQEIIVLRLSALGDVAMTLPLLYDVARSHEGMEIRLVTQPFMAGLLVEAPANLSVIPFDKKQLKGWRQVLRFARQLHQKYPRALVVDLHDVLRTKLVSYTLRGLGHRVVCLRKPRSERRRLLRRRDESLPSVPESLYVRGMVQLYQDTLERAGLDCPNSGVYLLPHGRSEEGVKVGFAPFAQHRAKMMMPEQVEQLVQTLIAEHPGVEVILYGAPGHEQEQNRVLASKFPEGRVVTTQAKGLSAEVAEIATLACMISMDSANQHIAAMVGTPVVSVWGATHPAAGFIPFRVSEEQCVGRELHCRPCSIYGNKPCWRGDYACIQQLDIQEIVQKVLQIVAR